MGTPALYGRGFHLKNTNMNKKIYLITTLLAVLFFASCEDVYDHVAAPPQSYEQEEAQSISGFTFALGGDLSSPIVLEEDDLDDVLLAINTTATPQLADGASVKFIIEASDTEDFVNVVAMTSAANGNNATILASDLNEVVKELYGKRPDAREIYFRANVYIVDGTTSSMLPEPVMYGPIIVTPVAPVIEAEYYMVGAVNGWAIDNLEDFKFNHSGKDVYEDPFFSILVENPGEFKIVPKSSKEAASWDGVFGTYEATALEGELKTDGGNLKVEEPGWVRVTLNMMEYTYEIEVIGEMNLTLYVPGSHPGGWDFNTGTIPTLYSRNLNFKYDGFIYFPEEKTEFKFTAGAGWDTGEYGDGGAGTLVTSGGGNIVVEGSGFYQINVDLSGAPYTYTTVKTVWGLIGSATAGGWDTDTEMVFDPETGIWSITTDLVAGEFKFRANNDWDFNLGGNINNLNYDGDNIPIEAGNYTITMDLSNSELYKGTIVKN